MDPEKCFYDVGANLGQTLLDVIYVAPDVHYVGFEPNPSSAAFIRNLIHLNELPNCEVHDVALFSSIGTTQLARSPVIPFDMSASIDPFVRPNRRVIRQPVPCTDFDSNWRSAGAPPIGMIKIDVEGAESDVLEGMTQGISKWRPPIICEVLLMDKDAITSKFNQHIDRLEHLLRQFQYSIFQVKTKVQDELPRLEGVTTLPRGIWTFARRSECDYLFLPSERVPDFISCVS